MKPLEGINVMEFSTMITAAFAAMMMAEQGARVIKVEPIDTGDPMRDIGASKGGISSLFANCNRGKQSVRINLKDQAGQALIRDMISEIDVLIHNFRPGVMDKLHLGSDELRRLNPRLIYAAISGFGTEGPLKNAPAYDPIVQVHAGLTATQGVGNESAFFRTLICDKITAYTACQAVTSALFFREKVGKGQHIDLSMFDSGLFFIFPDGFQNHTLLDVDHERGPLLIDLLYELFLTKDGAITIAAGNFEMQRRQLMIVGLEHLLEDERFNSFHKLVINFEELRPFLDEAFMRFTTDEALDKLQAADIPCARCYDKDEVLSQEQIAVNEMIEVIDHPIMGKMRIAKSPARFGGEQLDPAGTSPAHGENTEEVLRAFSISEDKILSMKRRGVVA